MQRSSSVDQNPDIGQNQASEAEEKVIHDQLSGADQFRRLQSDIDQALDYQESLEGNQPISSPVKNLREFSNYETVKRNFKEQQTSALIGNKFRSRSMFASFKARPLSDFEMFGSSKNLKDKKKLDPRLRKARNQLQFDKLSENLPARATNEQQVYLSVFYQLSEKLEHRFTAVDQPTVLPTFYSVLPVCRPGTMTDMQFKQERIIFGSMYKNCATTGVPNFEFTWDTYFSEQGKCWMLLHDEDMKQYVGATDFFMYKQSLLLAGECVHFTPSNKKNKQHCLQPFVKQSGQLNLVTWEQAHERGIQAEQYYDVQLQKYQTTYRSLMNAVTASKVPDKYFTQRYQRQTPKTSSCQNIDSEQGQTNQLVLALNRALGIKGSNQLRTSGIPHSVSMFHKLVFKTFDKEDTLISKFPAAVCALLSGSKNTLKGIHLKDINLQFVGELSFDDDGNQVVNSVFGKVKLRHLLRIERDQLDDDLISEMHDMAELLYVLFKDQLKDQRFFTQIVYGGKDGSNAKTKEEIKKLSATKSDNFDPDYVEMVLTTSARVFNPQSSFIDKKEIQLKKEGNQTFSTPKKPADRFKVKIVPPYYTQKFTTVDQSIALKNDMIDHKDFATGRGCDQNLDIDLNHLLDIVNWSDLDNVFRDLIKKDKKRIDQKANRTHYQACTAKYIDIYVPQIQYVDPDADKYQIQIDYYQALKACLEDHRHIRLNLTDEQFANAFQLAFMAQASYDQLCSLQSFTKKFSYDKIKLIVDELVPSLQNFIEKATTEEQILNNWLRKHQRSEQVIAVAMLEEVKDQIMTTDRKVNVQNQIMINLMMQRVGESDIMYENRSRIMVRHLLGLIDGRRISKELNYLENNIIRVHTYLCIRRSSDIASIVPNSKVPAYPNLLVPVEQFAKKHDGPYLFEVKVRDRKELVQVYCALIQLLWASFTEVYKLSYDSQTDVFARLLITCPMIMFNFARSLNFNIRIDGVKGKGEHTTESAHGQFFGCFQKKTFIVTLLNQTNMMVQRLYSQNELLTEQEKCLRDALFSESKCAMRKFVFFNQLAQLRKRHKQFGDLVDWDTDSDQGGTSDEESDSSDSDDSGPEVDQKASKSKQSSTPVNSRAPNAEKLGDKAFMPYKKSFIGGDVDIGVQDPFSFNEVRPLQQQQARLEDLLPKSEYDELYRRIWPRHGDNLPALPLDQYPPFPKSSRQ